MADLDAPAPGEPITVDIVMLMNMYLDGVAAGVASTLATLSPETSEDHGDFLGGMMEALTGSHTAMNECEQRILARLHGTERASTVAIVRAPSQNPGNN